MGDAQIFGVETSEETKSGVSKSKALQLTATKQLDIGKYFMKSQTPSTCLESDAANSTLASSSGSPLNFSNNSFLEKKNTYQHPSTSSLLAKGKKKLGKPISFKKSLYDEYKKESKFDWLDSKLSTQKEQKATWTLSNKSVETPKEESKSTNPILDMPAFKQLVLKAQFNQKKQKLLQANDAVLKLK